MKSLRFRILALVAGFGLISAVLLAGILFAAVRGYSADVVHEKSSGFAERVLEMHPDIWQRYQRNPRAFGERLREFVLYSPNTGLFLLDNEGNVLAAASDDGRRQRIDLTAVRAALADGHDAPIVSADPDRPGHTSPVAARPVMSGDQQAGWLYVVSRGADLASDEPDLLRSYTVRTAITVSLTTLSIGVLLTVTVLALLTSPLIELTRVVERVRDSGFTDELAGALSRNSTRDDEIGRLSRTFRDTFERLRQETRRVEQTDAQRREMIASVSHDLRTPLTALMGQLETIRMKSDATAPPMQQQLLDRAMLNAQHLQRLTDALAELSRLDNPGFRTHLEPIAIGELADDVVQRFASRASDAGLALSLEYPDGLPLIRVDAGLIERALANLLDNALRVTPSGGQVTVRVLREADAIRLEVADTGPGVASEDQPRVFDRFYQASRHRELRGSAGLGLAIVRRVAELHGGRVGLDSAPGHGALFFIVLPQHP